MGEYRFTLRTDKSELGNKPIGRFNAFIPDEDTGHKAVNKKKFPKFINIEDAIFKTGFNGGNESIFITPGILEESPRRNPRAVEYSEATAAQFFWYRVARDKSQKMAFTGLALAVIGAGIDTAFAIGKVHIFIPVGYQWLIFWLGIAFLLKIAGIWLVFRKGFWDAK
jgi:hypothetical protein